MGYFQTHLKLIDDKTIISSSKAKRGYVYQLRYDSKTATKSKYLVLALNIYPKTGGKSKQLLHCLDLDEIPVIQVRKIVRTTSGIGTKITEGLEHQYVIIEGRNTAYYDKEVKKLQRQIPNIYKTFKLSKIKSFELCNYNFIEILDTTTKKKFGLLEDEN
jgi:hypothetical protein